MPETSGVLKVMETLKRSHGQVVLVADEYGTLQGLVTPIDILEAIAGEFPDEDEQPVIQLTAPGTWRVDGSADLHHLEQVLDARDLVSGNGDYSSLAGLMLERFGTLPKAGDSLAIGAYRFEVTQMVERRIATVTVVRLEEDALDPATAG